MPPTPSASVERERAGRDDSNFDFRLRVAEAHDGTVAVAFVDAGNWRLRVRGRATARLWFQRRIFQIWLP